MSQDYISMAEAAKLTGYDQEYLGLLSRQGKIRSKMVGKKWYTTVDQLNAYLQEKRPGELIEKRFLFSSAKRGKNHGAKVLVAVLFLGFALLVFEAYNYTSVKFSAIEQKASSTVFVPEGIIKIPNDGGNFDVYSEGRVKMGEEKSSSSNQENILP
jgi:hypothetical protein